MVFHDSVDIEQKISAIELAMIIAQYLFINAVV